MSAILPEPINSDDERTTAYDWGQEDAFLGNGFCAPRFFVPGSFQWTAYQIGYDRGRQLLNSPAPVSPPPPAEPPRIWALRGYEDALFDRPIRANLPPVNSPDHADYHAGYVEGAAANNRILGPRNSTLGEKTWIPITKTASWQTWLNPFTPPASSGDPEP